MTTAVKIVAELAGRYRGAVDRQQAALTACVTAGTAPGPESRRDGSFAYPEILLHYRGGEAGRRRCVRSGGW